MSVCFGFFSQERILHDRGIYFLVGFLLKKEIYLYPITMKHKPYLLQLRHTFLIPLGASHCIIATHSIIRMNIEYAPHITQINARRWRMDEISADMIGWHTLRCCC